LALLIIYGLNRVHIPFTAFAFLGGTLAIGIGFGAQNLLKNFISGVILSLERPFKVGDLIEVGDIIGNILRIGLRATVIRHFDGTDTLVPNSTLLENRVSNWTLSDSAMRGRVEVGVAYGSSKREVTRLLLTVAEEHGLVLKHPEPTVQFDAFGDNALQFSLLYWFDAMRTRRDPLASDLRFMIDRAFAKAGIVIAFPQRDIHIDEREPLRIEVSRPARAAVEKHPTD
jgi:small-conductance mechanosensitive channel